MKVYLDFLRHILQSGTPKGDRTGTGTLSIFAHQMRFDLTRGFPLLTTKKLHLKSVIYELLWFLRGDTNTAYLKEHGVSIWDEWADADGNLGPIYGKQWRFWQTADHQSIDQVSQLMDQIKRNPDSRRLVLSAWNVADLAAMALPPCHLLLQFYVVNSQLSCQVYQRSADAFLGVPFNIASYALLTHMVAQQCDLQVAELIWTGGDCHIYNNHVEAVRLQLLRQPYNLPELVLRRKPDSIFSYDFDDFVMSNYQCHPIIRAAVAV